MILNAGGAADLAGETNAATSVGVAEVAAAIVGRAGNGLELIIASLAGSPWAPVVVVAAANDKLGSTTAVDPYAVVIESPCLILDAGGAADLTGEADTATSVGVAEVAIIVVRGAGDGLAALISSPVAAAATAYNEFGSAAAIDPYAGVVESPSLVLDAGGAADLAGEADAAARVGVAEVASAIVGGAGDGLGVALAIETEGCKEQEKMRSEFHFVPLGLILFLGKQQSKVQGPVLRWSKRIAGWFRTCRVGCDFCGR